MVQVLRVLCREDFSIQSAKMFVADLKTALKWLDAHFIYTPEQVPYRAPEYWLSKALGSLQLTPHSSYVCTVVTPFHIIVLGFFYLKTLTVGRRVPALYSYLGTH